MSVRRLTRCAVLTALALALSVAEGLVPLTVLIPLPGLRLGLANLVTLYALYALSGRDALLILVARCLLGALVGGNLMALAFSLTGGLLSLGVMALLRRVPGPLSSGCPWPAPPPITPGRFSQPWWSWAASLPWFICPRSSSVLWSPGPLPARWPPCWCGTCPLPWNPKEKLKVL